MAKWSQPTLIGMLPHLLILKMRLERIALKEQIDRYVTLLHAQKVDNGRPDPSNRNRMAVPQAPRRSPEGGSGSD